MSANPADICAQFADMFKSVLTTGNNQRTESEIEQRDGEEPAKERAEKGEAPDEATRYFNQQRQSPNSRRTSSCRRSETGVSKSRPPHCSTSNGESKTTATNSVSSMISFSESVQNSSITCNARSGAVSLNSVRCDAPKRNCRTGEACTIL